MDSRQPTIPELIDELVVDIRSALGDELVGIYLYGSYVSGEFDPGVSDLDLVAVTMNEADRIDLAGIGGMHLAFADRHPDWNDRIETVYIGRGALSSFRTSPGRLAVISPGEPFHLRNERPIEWVQNWYLIRESGLALLGPPADSLIPSIAWGEFVDAARRYGGEIAAKDLDTVSPGNLSYTMLTMCRAQRVVEAQAYGSKQEAADWAKERWPAWAPVIDAALRCRLSGGTAGFDDDATRAEAIWFVRKVAAEVSGANPPTGEADLASRPT